MTTSMSHLVGRFFGSLVAGNVAAVDLEWVQSILTDEEWRLWQRMGRIDRVESVQVARRAAEQLGDGDEAVWLAAALLHDVGKRDCGFGTFRRAGATLMGRLAGRETTHAWMSSTGHVRRVGLYMHHDEIGSVAIQVAGGRPEVSAWAKVHHDPSRWRAAEIPAAVGRILAAADGERVLGEMSTLRYTADAD
jgi:HD domain